MLAEEVNIEDNRPITKKIASSLSSIAANLVGANGALAKNPLIAPLILIIIVLSIVVYYGRKPVMSLIKGKKEKDEDKKKLDK